MKIFFKIIFPILIGLGLLGISLWLFFLAKKDNSYLLLFGAATAILVPIALSCISFGLNFKDRKVAEKLTELTKINDIQLLLDKAKTAEEQIEILKTQYQNLEKNLRFNSEKIALELRREELLKKIKESITELDNIDENLLELGEKTSNYEMPVEVKLLRERVFKKQIAIIRINGKPIIYTKYILPSIIDELVFLTFQLIEDIQRKKLKNEVTKIDD